MTGPPLLSGLDQIAEAYRKRGHEICSLNDMNPRIMRRTLGNFVRNCPSFDQDMAIMNNESRKRFCKSSIDNKISNRMRQLNLQSQQNGSGESKNRNSPESVETEDTPEPNDDFAIDVARASWHLRNLIFRKESGAFTESKSNSSSQHGEVRRDDSFGRGLDRYLGLADVDISRSKLSGFGSFSDFYSHSSLTGDFASGGGSGNTSMTKTPSTVSLKSSSGSGGESDEGQNRSRNLFQSVGVGNESQETKDADNRDYFVASFDGDEEDHSDSKDSKANSRSSSSTTSSNKRKRDHSRTYD